VLVVTREVEEVYGERTSEEIRLGVISILNYIPSEKSASLLVIEWVGRRKFTPLVACGQIKTKQAPEGTEKDI
jgi:hypothetical protein